MVLTLKNMIHHGSVRACYYHPNDPALCVKVSIARKHDNLLTKEINNNTKFQSLLTPYVPKYYDTVDTNYGLGLISDLITDEKTNTISPMLQDWLKIHQKLTTDLQSQFQDFFERLLKYSLWFYDFNFQNFLIQKKSDQWHMFFVDTKSYNRNNSWSLFKLEYVIPVLARARMKRRIHRFYETINLPIPDTLK